MAYQTLFLALLINLTSFGQAAKYMEKDTVVNIDLWTHISREQLPKYILPEEKDSLYSTQIKRTGKSEITVYLLYVGAVIQEKKIPCKFKKNKIVIDPIIEFRGEFITWGRTSLKRKIIFDNLAQIEYHSKMKSFDFQYMVWISKITRQKLRKTYNKSNLYGIK